MNTITEFTVYTNKRTFQLQADHLHAAEKSAKLLLVESEYVILVK